MNSDHLLFPHDDELPDSPAPHADADTFDEDTTAGETMPDAIEARDDADETAFPVADSATLSIFPAHGAGPVDDLYAPALRDLRLLSREEEESLGRTLRESRLQMTACLARVPAAVGVFVDCLTRAEAREGPITDALTSPFDRFAALDDESSDGDELNWRDAARVARSLYAEWTRVNTDPAEAARRDAVRARLARFACAIEPGLVALRRALALCSDLDARVSAIEAERGAYHADIPDDPADAGRAALLRIREQAGVDLTTLRESRRAAAGACARYSSARDRMVNANLRLAYYMAHRLRGSGLAFEDLVQEAMIGLMRAVDKFDYRMGYKFSTYAVQWIRQTTTRAIADASRTIRVATHVHDDIVRLRKIGRMLEQRLGHEPDIAELAASSGIPQAKVEHYLRLAREPASLDTPPADIEDTPLSAMVADATFQDAETGTHDLHLARSVAAVLDTLPPREALILRLRHGIDGTEVQTLESIGRMLGITRERTRQLEARAVAHLRETIKRDLLEGLDD